MTLDDDDGGAEDGGGTDFGTASGDFGDRCTSSDECESGLCIAAAGVVGV